MCIMSVVMTDHLRKPALPDIQWDQVSQYIPTVSRIEYDRLKRELEELKVELAKAKAQDIANGEPDCEMEDKVLIIRGLAKALGVNLGDLLADHK